MTRTTRIALALGAAGILSIGAHIAVVPAGEQSKCSYSYVYADDAELARRLMARAQVVMARGKPHPTLVSVYDDDEWWRRARILPKAGIVDCGVFRATIHYAVDTEQERVTVEGDRGAYEKWRDDMRKKNDTKNPFWVDLRKWEKHH